MWMDDLSKTSQKKMLGNAYIYIMLIFLPLDFFSRLRNSETFIAFSYGQI